MNYTLTQFKHPDGKTFEMVTFNEDKFPEFLIEWIKIKDFVAEFIIYEVTSWLKNSEPSNYEMYLRGSIKWDGCSHIYFGKEDSADGYQHLCGKRFFDEHCNILQAIWDICSKRIKNFNPVIAS